LRGRVRALPRHLRLRTEDHDRGEHAAEERERHDDECPQRKTRRRVDWTARLPAARLLQAFDGESPAASTEPGEIILREIPA